MWVLAIKNILQIRFTYVHANLITIIQKGAPWLPSYLKDKINVSCLINLNLIHRLQKSLNFSFKVSVRALLTAKPLNQSFSCRLTILFHTLHSLPLVHVLRVENIGWNLLIRARKLLSCVLSKRFALSCCLSTRGICITLHLFLCLGWKVEFKCGINYAYILQK